ncbi:unannotated protein [freshwater metagenome]|uniref:Unannotated protein n=1 Tax=freshwater metagenome TaxID=449393 RepID=A0A6J7C8B8_9ZZZZ
MHDLAVTAHVACRASVGVRAARENAVDVGLLPSKIVRVSELLPSHHPQALHGKAEELTGRLVHSQQLTIRGEQHGRDGGLLHREPDQIDRSGVDGMMGSVGAFRARGLLAHAEPPDLAPAHVGLETLTLTSTSGGRCARDAAFSLDPTSRISDPMMPSLGSDGEPGHPQERCDEAGNLAAAATRAVTIT